MNAATRFGRPLPDGGTIGVPAPASPWENRSDLLRGVEWWESRGYRVKLADGILERDDYVAGSPEQRGRDVTAMFADPEVDVVQCLQGGFGSAQAIPHIDFDVIAANPKPFVGYSDITALHVAIRQRTGLATIYGYGLAGMGAADSTDFSRDRLLSILKTGGTGDVPPDPDDPYVRAIAGGKVTAPARRRLPLAPHPDDGDALGVRGRRVHPLLRGRRRAALVRGRKSDPARPRRQTRTGRRSRSR